eukprot:g544.t1
MGALSRDGWAVLDDGGTPVFDREVRLPAPVAAGAVPRPAQWPWAGGRAAGSSGSSARTADLYLFGCGNEAFEPCLGDLASLTGAIALPPRSVLGLWWSHYEPISQEVLVTDVLAHHANLSIPLNHIVLDVNWHINNTPKPCQGFGGFTWNTTLFPDHAGLVAELQAGGGPKGYNRVARALKVALNTHSFLGVDRCQAQYERLVRDVGIDTRVTHATVALNVSNASLVASFFADVLGDQKPLLDAWWVDGSLSKWTGAVGAFGADGRNNMAFWSFAHDSHDWLRGIAAPSAGAGSGAARRRPLQLGPRRGLLGQHRAPVGFSGDAATEWATLQAEVNMTKTAANTLYAWWSHDIGGFLGTPTDELMLRWVQFGALSPVMRTHGKVGTERRVWRFPSFERMRRAMLLRLALVPYLYGAARTARDSGLALLRPLHIAWPAQPRAYPGSTSDAFGTYQFMVGPDLLARPIVTPADPSSPDQPGPAGFRRATGTQRVRVWLPPSARGWVDWNSSRVVPSAAGDSGTVVAVSAGPDDVPIYVRAGAVMPLAPAGTLDANERRAVVWVVFPGGGGTPVNGTLYDDDGESDAFLRGGSSRTTATAVDSGANTTVTIGAAVLDNPGFDGAGVSERNVTLEFRGRGRGARPRSVACEALGTAGVSDSAGPCVPGGDAEPSVVVPAGHSLARPEGALLVGLGALPVSQAVRVTVVW